MFKSFFPHFRVNSVKKRHKEVTLDFLITQLTIPPLNQRHFIASGEKGRATSVTTVPNGLLLTFERKIGEDDVANGRLLPAAHQDIKRRGGKRVTSVCLSLETAEEVHRLLGHVLRHERKRSLLADLVQAMWVATEWSAAFTEERS